jgi:hypothetical protein
MSAVEPHRSRARRPLPALFALAAIALGGCVLDLQGKHACRSDGDCLAGRACVLGLCQAPGPAGAAGNDGSGDAGAMGHADAGDADAPDGATPADGGGTGGARDGGGAGQGVSDGAGGDAVEAEADTGPPPPLYAASGTPNYVFVTSTKHALSFGSLEAADAICGDAAKAGHLPGTFRAWLSSSTVAARDRLGAARGWIRPDGAPFADSVVDIMSDHILYPPVVDELGHEVRGSFAVDPVVTGTSTQTSGGIPCHDWSSISNKESTWAGVPYDGPQSWTAFGAVTCDVMAHFYCFGIDHTTALQVVPQPGKKAFVTDGSFTTTGLDGADRLCAAEAAKAGLPGTFTALLATTGGSASERFPSPDHRWVRLDGVPLVEPGQDLFRDGPRTAPLSVSSTGAYVISWVMTGAGSPLALSPDLRSSCANWEDTGQVETLGISGITNHLDDWFDHLATPDLCFRRGNDHVYCLEQ